MTDTKKRKKWDGLGRRSDRVKPRERQKMKRLYDLGYSVTEIAVELDRKPQTVKHHLSIASGAVEKALREGEIGQAVSREVIAKIEKLAKRLEQLTHVPRPETQLLSDDRQAEEKIVEEAMRGNSHAMLSAMVTAMGTPWWSASGSVQISRHLTREQDALFKYFMGLTTSGRFKATLSDWEQKASTYLGLKQVNAAPTEIQVAYEQAMQAEYALHSELWDAVVALSYAPTK